MRDKVKAIVKETEALLEKYVDDESSRLDILMDFLAKVKGLADECETVDEWVCSDCGAPSRLVKTGFRDYVKPECTACGSGNATAVNKEAEE